MRLTFLECRDFRCLEQVRFEPAPGVNLIRGGNAQGKTSLLEAILYVATSKSHRTTNDPSLVRHGQEGFRIRAQAERIDRSVELEANTWHGAKRFKVNGVTQSRTSDLLGRLNVVFFSPEDVELVKGGAAVRRRFLDMELSQIDHAYLNALQQYRQVLRQRNELLRQHRPDHDLLAAWDAQMVQYGERLQEARARFIGELSPLASEAYGRIAGGETLDLAYRPDVRKGEGFAAVLEQARETDLRRQHTSRGPHRDDIRVLLGGHRARVYGSQGQQKTAALALKLAELELVKSRTGEYPVLMLDEVLAELDAERARQLLAAVGPRVQCLLTTTELDLAEPAFREPCTNFFIKEGRLEKA